MLLWCLAHGDCSLWPWPISVLSLPLSSRAWSALQSIAWDKLYSGMCVKNWLNWQCVLRWKGQPNDTVSMHFPYRWRFLSVQWLITLRLCVSCWEPALKEQGVLGRSLLILTLNQSTKKLISFSGMYCLWCESSGIYWPAVRNVVWKPYFKSPWEPPSNVYWYGNVEPQLFPRTMPQDLGEWAGGRSWGWCWSYAQCILSRGPSNLGIFPPFLREPTTFTSVFKLLELSLWHATVAS